MSRGFLGWGILIEMNYILTILLHGLRNDFQSPTSIAAKILLLVGCLALGALPSDAAPRANQGPAPTAQQVEVLLLSSRDPDSVDINALINQAESEMVGGFKKAAHFSLEYVDPLSLADAPQRPHPPRKRKCRLPRSKQSPLG